MEPNFPTVDPEVMEAARRPPVILEDEERIEERPSSKGIPSKPLLGFLPIARLIPQDVHSVMDYVDAISTGSGALLSNDPRVKLASVLLGASVAGVSLITDYRLSVAKILPIEVHEAADHLWGVSAIALPFVLGYWKTSPKVAMIHVAMGIGTCIASLFTDYRAQVGRGHRGTR